MGFFVSRHLGLLFCNIAIMKRFLPLLIILPLLFWSACEEETEDFTFIEEWVECKRLATEFIYEDNESWGENDEYVHNWSGDTEEILKNGELSYTHVYNEYGKIIRSLYPSGSETHYEIFDKWKTLSEIRIDASGDTSYVNHWEWDSLTVDINRDFLWDDLPPFPLRKYHFNEFGRLLEAYNIENDSIVWHRVWEYEDDGRRVKSRTTDGELTYEAHWDNDSREIIYYNGGQFPEYKYESTLNEYYRDIQTKYYDYHDGYYTVTLVWTENSEYECPGFEQIYP